jgi:uncharacterized protein
MAGQIDVLLNLVPDHPDRVLNALQATPSLADQQDAHGYSLVHAAVSYNHVALLRRLVHDYKVDVNITDEDGETALFNAESVDMAKELIALGITVDKTNSEGQTAAEKLDDEDEQPLVATYLKEHASHPAAESATSAPAHAHNASRGAATTNGTSDDLHRPPPLPNGVKINVGTMQEDEAGEEPDPDFRRRIEELAARDDFETEEGQRELRNLVQDAVGGLRQEEGGQGNAQRRRLG